jgi:high-affinity iron transporter
VAALAGLATAVAIGWAIFALGVRIDLRRFFTVTGVVLVFVSGGLVAFAVAEFTEAGLLRGTPVVVDLGAVLPVTSPLGSVLAGLLGYRDAPTALELAAYLGYVVPVLLLFVADGRLPRLAAATSAAALLVAVGLVGFGSGRPSGGPPAANAATTIEVEATEYAFTPDLVTVPAGSVAFHVTNSGAEEHEFEIFHGEQVVDEIEGLVPGLDRTLVVDLPAGRYTFVCKLAGHDLAGMTGTLVVTGG